MTDTLLSLLPWLLPPLLGAVIGYVTNSIAIRMLFRPLHERRVLGIRVPFTPGIIPGQRFQLAESIATMVSDELINEETLKRQVTADTFVQRLRESVSALTGRLLSAPLPGTGNGEEHAAGVPLRSVLVPLLERLIESEGTRGFLSRLTTEAVHTIAAQPLSLLVPPGESLDRTIEKVLARLGEEQTREKLALAVREWTWEQLKGNRPLGSFLPEGTATAFLAMLDGLYPRALELLVEWLRTDSTRLELEIRGRFVLRGILERLNVVQRLLISAGQFHRNLEEKMPIIVEDIIDSVEASGAKRDNRRRIIRTVGRGTRAFLRQGVADAAAELGIDPGERFAAIVRKGMEFLLDANVRERISGEARTFLEPLLDLPVGEVAERYLGLQEQDFVAAVDGAVSRWLSSPGRAEELIDRAEKLIRDVGVREEGKSFERILGIDPDLKARIDSYLSDRTLDLIERNLPEALRVLHVRKLVVDRINGLDVAHVERLLMMVISRHLKWINLFGALLGALIGGLQVVIGLLT